MNRTPKPTVLLDGGLATELEAQGHVLNTVLWSAEFLRSDPRALVDAHLAFLRAGAEILTSASYQASRAGFHQVGIDAQEADKLIVSSVALARAACDEYAASNPALGTRKVAASIGPYGAVLNDGSEYTGDYGVSATTLRLFHERRLALLDASGADYLAVETVPSLLEAKVLAELLDACNTPAWVSFSCKDERHISDGNDIAEAAKMLANHPRVFAIGVNCTAPRYVESLLTRIAEAAPGKELVAYPNSGERYDTGSGAWQGTGEPLDFVSAAASWTGAGAGYIGGCCRISPAHIEALARNRI